MPVKDNREYRNIGTFEIEERAEGMEPSYMVSGYASTFEPYKMYERDGKDYYERIDRNAFDEADLSDVVFLRDHQGRVLARTKNGAIELSIDDHGLHHNTNLGLTGASREMHEDIATGNYSQMSFSFVVRDGDDHYDRATRTRVIDRIAKVFDISAVSFPANPGTDIGISYRDYFDGVIEAEKAERLEAEKRQREVEKLKLLVQLEREKIHGN